MGAYQPLHKIRVRSQGVLYTHTALCEACWCGFLEALAGSARPHTLPHRGLASTLWPGTGECEQRWNQSTSSSRTLSVFSLYRCQLLWKVLQLHLRKMLAMFLPQLDLFLEDPIQKNKRGGPVWRLRQLRYLPAVSRALSTPWVMC